MSTYAFIDYHLDYASGVSRKVCFYCVCGAIIAWFQRKCYVWIDTELVLIKFRVYRAAQDNVMYEKIDVINHSVDNDDM